MADGNRTVLPVCVAEHRHLGEKIGEIEARAEKRDEQIARRVDDLDKQVRRLTLYVLGAATIGGALPQIVSHLL